jgi:predicted RND superfamily exporter protein
MNNKFQIVPVILLIISVATSLYIFPSLVFDDSLQNWIPQDSPAIQEYRHFLDEFKSDAFILVSVHILPEANNR